MKQTKKSKAAILLGMGMMIAASYLNAARPNRIAPTKAPVEIQANISSADEWDTPFLNNGAP